MNIALVLVALSTLWLNSCVATQKKISRQDDFFKTWLPVVDFLNQDGSEHGGNAADLMHIYDEEMTYFATRAEERGGGRQKTVVS